jgi:hypothetical protein
VHVRERPPGSRKWALFRRGAPGIITVGEHTAPAAAVSEHTAATAAPVGEHPATAAPAATVRGEPATATAATRTAAGGSSARLSAEVRC